MKIILTQAVPGLGEAGTIKEVADGYARNFLLPRKLAVAATRASLKQAEEQAELYARKAGKARAALEGAAGAIEGKQVTIRARAGSENRLYGSITSADLSDALQEQYGISVDRRKIELTEPIHRLGTYSATADLGNGVTANFSVEVAPEVAGAHGKATRASASASVAEEPTEAESAPQAEADVPATEQELEAEAEANPS
jgi:large subunit ribosomal protein L9